MRRVPCGLGVVLCLAGAAAGSGQTLAVYDDTLQNAFQDWSYGGGTSFASTGTVHGGTDAISFDQSSFASAVSFAHPAAALSATQYPLLHFWVHGGPTGGQALQIDLQLGGAVVATGSLDGYVAGGSIAANAWREVTVTFSQAPLSYSGSFDRIDVQGASATAQPVLFIDDVALLTGTGTAASPLRIDHDVSVGSMASDRFTWQDAAGKPRVAVLAHNDVSGPNGVRGGALREFRYQLSDGSTRICSVTTYGNGAYGGFGYVVSHRGDATAGISADDSPLGFAFGGSWQRLFEGRHHAIFRFTQLYPRYSSTTANPANTLYQVPVTVDWIFSTGRDNPAWAVTWDLSGVPAGALDDDSRAPYGELNVDGTGTADVSGVAWGDRFRFTSSAAPVTLDSTWSWTQANAVPYVKLWIAPTDATMGLVQTQTLAQHDAGAGRNPDWHDLTPFWTRTSAQGNAGGANVMPWQDSWPYQANAFSLAGGVGGSSNNARLTWGSMYGFLGQPVYDTNNGLVATASGWPRQSYTTYVVLGAHSSGPVETQVSQVEAAQSVTLTAATGSVVAGGPAGINRSDTVSYSPPGYDPVYGALTFSAAANALDANVAVGSGNLVNPLVVIGNYTSSTYPVVKLGGIALVQDVDYFPSLRASANELWLTLNRALGGPANRLEVTGGAPPPPILLHVLTPCRVYDTRSASGPAAGAPALAAGSVRVVATAGRCGVPATARALSANVTVAAPVAPGFLTLFPSDTGSAPLASTINFRPGGEGWGEGGGNSACNFLTGHYYLNPPFIKGDFKTPLWKRGVGGIFMLRVEILVAPGP